MDYRTLFQEQARFDAKFKDIPKTERIEKKFLGLIVELGEAANETPKDFKYWSETKTPSSIKNARHYAELYNHQLEEPIEDELLEELSDKFHFILSLGLELNVVEHAMPFLEMYGPTETDKPVADLFMDLVANITYLHQGWRLQERIKKEVDIDTQDTSMVTDYVSVFYTFFQLVGQLGYGKQLEEAYHVKHKKNEIRQAQGY